VAFDGGKGGYIEIHSTWQIHIQFKPSPFRINNYEMRTNSIQTPNRQTCLRTPKRRKILALPARRRQQIINQKDILGQARTLEVDPPRIPLFTPRPRDLVFRIPPDLLGSPLVVVTCVLVGNGVCPKDAVDVGEGRVFDVGGPAFFEEGDGYLGEGFALGLDCDSAKDVVGVFKVCAGKVVYSGGSCCVSQLRSQRGGCWRGRVRRRYL